MYITPVLTGLEYVAFRSFGVGLWQARLVSRGPRRRWRCCCSAWASRESAGACAGLVAAGLLAIELRLRDVRPRRDHGSARWSSLIVASWYCYVRARESPRWGDRWPASPRCSPTSPRRRPSSSSRPSVLDAAAHDRGGAPDDGGPAAGGRPAAAPRAAGAQLGAGSRWPDSPSPALLASSVFVAPNWQDYRFYNWQMSVTRKPIYTLQALRRPAVVVSGHPRLLHAHVDRDAAGPPGRPRASLCRWRQAAPAERVLLLWLVFWTGGTRPARRRQREAPGVPHPGLVALAALALARDRRLLDEPAPRHVASGAPCWPRRSVFGAPVHRDRRRVRLPFADRSMRACFARRASGRRPWPRRRGW